MTIFQEQTGSNNPFDGIFVGYYASPTLADIDDDGDLDAFVGQYYGSTSYYQNTGTASAPTFAAPQINAFNLTDVGFYTSPTFADIDDDGDLDAFVGEYGGNTYYYENTGTALNPAFAAPQINAFNLTNEGYRASPTFTDIDSDGDLDAFIGNSDGNTYYYENTGTALNPAFAAPQSNAFNLTDVGNSSAPTFADIDDDGNLDAFIGGASDGTIRYYQKGLFASITAGTSPSEAEPAAPITGNFVVTLSEVSATDVMISYTVAGTATAGNDYTPLTGSVTIAAGQTSANIDVTPILDSVVDPEETVQLTLTTATAGYNVGTAKTAVLTIADNVHNTFNAPQINPFNLTNIGLYASPTLADIDSDGDLDAFVGEYGGNTYYYENTGTASAPAFAAPQINPFNLTDVEGNMGGDFASPTFADIDGDGDLDAFIEALLSDDGSTYYSNIYYYENTGTALNPAFAAPQINAFNFTAAGYWASPTLADIDSDGDLDAFVGTGDGFKYYYENTGTALNPAFAAPQINPFNLTQVGSSASPTLADIDSDGDLDAFIGEYGGNTYYYENTGTASAPAFAAPQINPFNLTNVGLYASPTFADIDSDGDLDAFIGTGDGTIHYYQNSTPIVSIAAGTSPSETGVAGSFTLTLSEPATDDFTVAYTVGGTATNGTDYTALTGTVTFAPGATAATINVVATNDAIIDPDETVTVTLTDTASYNVAPAPANTATLTIADNDIGKPLPILSIAAGAVVPAEGGATGSFTLTLSESATDDFTVAYTVAGTATNGTDYAALTGTATFAPGATTATINVVATDDAIIEPNETVTITLTDGASYNLATTPADTATLSIADNDIAYAIVANSATVTEGNTGTRAITYTITRTGRTDVASSVNMGFGGSATNSSDYTLGGVAGTGITNTGNTVNFASGATSATVTLNVVGDAVVESNETIEVSLTANTTPAGFQATVPNTTPATTTITNDDTGGLLRTGTAGNDTIYGHGGNDTLEGLGGNDNLQSGGGKDLLLGGTGRDSLMRGAGDDSLDGGNDNDTLLGGDSNDTLLGCNNNDSLLGGSGHDWLDGGVNNDTLIGGSGNDTLRGGSGKDVFIFTCGNGVDTLVDFTTTGSSKDTLGLTGGLRFEQLTIASAANPANTIIKVTNSDEILATLIGVQASSINSSHFLSI